MNESKLEAISALVDGEAAPGGIDAVAELVRDAEARRHWGRYHLISDCMRRQLPPHIDPALGGRIEVSLRDEPTVLAPEPAAHAWLRPLAGLAVAASVAAFSVMAVRMDRNAADAPAAPQVASAGTGQIASQGRVRLAAGNDAGGPARAQTTPGRMNARLNRYLVNYNEYRNNAAVQGMIPYVRIVAHDEDK
ncbi:MAG TPA: RseA family anti-sigma factor [Gammaproteobacteria bacterium]|jgi:sigma-E factor negative regulatory protein RseA